MKKEKLIHLIVWIRLRSVVYLALRVAKENEIGFLIIDFVNPINHELYITRSCAKQISNIVTKCGNNLPYFPYRTMYCF